MKKLATVLCIACVTLSLFSSIRADDPPVPSTLLSQVLCGHEAYNADSVSFVAIVGNPNPWPVRVRVFLDGDEVHREVMLKPLMRYDHQSYRACATPHVIRLLVDELNDEGDWELCAFDTKVVPCPLFD